MGKLALLAATVILGSTLPLSAQINLGNMVEVGDITIPQLQADQTLSRLKAPQFNIVYFKSLVHENVGSSGVYRNVLPEDIGSFFKGVEKYSLDGSFVLQPRENNQGYLVCNGYPAVDAARAMRRKVHANILLSICPQDLAKTAPKILLEFHKTVTTPATGNFEIVTSVLEDQIASTFYTYKLGLISIMGSGKDRTYIVVPLEINPDVHAIAEKLMKQTSRSYVKTATVL